MKEAFRIITEDDKVKAILVNVFGGIVNCATIANGIVNACKSIDLKVTDEGNRWVDILYFSLGLVPYRNHKILLKLVYKYAEINCLSIWTKCILSCYKMKAVVRDGHNFI